MAQRYTLTIQATDKSTAPADSIFVAGNFNSWNPAKLSFAMKKNAGTWQLTIPSLPPDVIEFKMTRGSWEKVETMAAGGEVQNHVLTLRQDTTVVVSIEAWKDMFAPVAKKHTASANVHLIDTAFYMPQLGRTRSIAVYLPPGYDSSLRRYPVMYMHDGQNLFDEAAASYGEWGVDETLDSLIMYKKQKPCIVVGIYNGRHRMNEYNPYAFEQFGAGEGDAYVDFIRNSLKPFIDSSYRTMPGPSATIIAGSSMGGLISYYAMLKYPQTFGKAGIFSPAFWTADAVIALSDSLAGRQKGMMFFYMGKLEGKQYLDDMMKVSDKVGRLSAAYIYTAIDDKGMHNEQAWRKWFPQFYTWIMSDGYNHIIKTKGD